MTFDERSVPNSGTGTVTFLPEPERRERKYAIISVDDHVVEPPHTFEGRMPAKFQDRAPRVVPHGNGQSWLYDGKLLPNVGINAVVGRPVNEYSRDPTHFDDMRRGSWDIDARIADMDLDGVYASLNFPSFLAGFGGGRIQTATDDLELALAAVRAWNSWHLEEWAGSYPDRIIPCQLPWLHARKLAADEVRRNAELGFRALTFPEAPDKLGFPSIHSGHWEELFAACAETDTVLCLHVGSGGSIPNTSPDAPFGVGGVLFGVCAMTTAVDWLFSGVGVRFPDIKVCLSEGGIGWVPALLDRLDHCSKYDTWWTADVTPREVLRRNFWFCALEDPSTMPLNELIGVDRIMFEVDYPHADSSWPDSQAVLGKQLDSLPEANARRISWQNASELFRHPVPVAVQNDPNAF